MPGLPVALGSPAVNGTFGITGSAGSSIAIAPPNAASKGTVTAVPAVGSAGVVIPAAALANRKTLFIYNLDAANAIWIGDANVAQNQGVKLGPGSGTPWNEGPNVSVYAVSDAAAPVNVFTLEQS